MSEHEDSIPKAASTRMLEEIAERLAAGFIHQVFRLPARLVCPSDEAEQSVVDAMTRAATQQGIPIEIVDLRLAPAERLNAVTTRLDGWERGAPQNHPGSPLTLLILRGFDVFGDDTQDGPIYPFRSKFQFDRKFLWLFVGRDISRMRYLFGSRQRPLYSAAADITPENWQLDQ